MTWSVKLWHEKKGSGSWPNERKGIVWIKLRIGTRKKAKNTNAGRERLLKVRKMPRKRGGEKERKRFPLASGGFEKVEALIVVRG